MTHFSIVLYPPPPKDALSMLTSVPPKNILFNKGTLAMGLRQAARQLQTSMIRLKNWFVHVITLLSSFTLNRLNDYTGRNTSIHLLFYKS